MNRLKNRTESRNVELWVPRTLCQALSGVCLAFVMLNSASLLAQDDTATATTTFLVVRHAERQGNMDKLSAAGIERAQTLAAVGSALRVQAIYSTNTKRTRNTVQPLASLTETNVTTYGRLSRDWIESLKQKHAGQVVMIVGHSNTTGVIAGLLANKKPFEIGHDEYDSLFIVQVSESESHCVRLQYGVSSKGAPSADPDKMGVSTEPAESK